ncbi:MAG TPA: signal recognition particle-docking protein FtsY, partial [Gammaproteobacteria bacterium]|nr:signal recognition particle-docking protein FtsY [Gammaproteobacteria bacterium]
MNWLDRTLAILTRFLETVGVPEGQRSLAALGLLYAGAILLVLLLVLVIWRLRRSAKKPGEGVAPVEEEAPAPPEEFPGAEAEVGEEAEAEI